MSSLNHPATTAATAEEASKDECFQRVAEVASALIDLHGKDFAMGALLIAARFIAEGKSLTTMKSAD